MNLFYIVDLKIVFVLFKLYVNLICLFGNVIIGYSLRRANCAHKSFLINKKTTKRSQTCQSYALQYYDSLLHTEFQMSSQTNCDLKSYFYNCLPIIHTLHV